MAIVTSQQITRLYESYRRIDVAFNKSVSTGIGLETKSIYLKCLDKQWPCIIYSASMNSAKLIMNLDEDHFDQIDKAKKNVSLRLAFHRTDRHDVLSFFIAAKITDYTPYNPEKSDTYFVSLYYTHRPPDSFIEIIGKLLEANTNARKRNEERIVITADSMRKLDLKSSDAYVQIEGVPRKCIIRDISFGGAKILVIGVAKFLMDKRGSLKLEFEDLDEPIEIVGTIIRIEQVEGRRDIAALGLKYDEPLVPLPYKLKINEYLKTVRSTS